MVWQTGGVRRTHVRGHANILNRLLSHVGDFILGLFMRTVSASERRKCLQEAVIVRVIAISTAWSPPGAIEKGSFSRRWIIASVTLRRRYTT